MDHPMRLFAVGSLLVGLLMACNRNASPQGSFSHSDDGLVVPLSNKEKLVLVSSSVSEARAALLPTEPSEDASHMLPTLEIAAPAGSNQDKEFLPSTKVSWVLTVNFSGQARLDPQQVSALFDKAWQQDFGFFAAYVQDADTDNWTFLVSANGPKAIKKLKFAWDYVDPVSGFPREPARQLFESRLAQVKEKLAHLGRPAVEPSLPVGEAVERARSLAQLRSQLDYSPVLVLKAPQGATFDGKAVWDVMLCLGLKWGDMDCFHWENRPARGNEHLFSVSTSTPPGYFLPEEVAAGRMQAADLVFGFSVPRSPAPIPVFNAMVQAAQYCQKRLGGSIAGQSGSSADLSSMRKRILEIERKLESAGFKPGSDDAQRLF
jgi:cell division protein ZipA